ncbi:MAG: YhfC family glutamic-type intramembrane protease [Armatimonadota bacterium]
MLYFTYALNAALMIALPLLLGVFLAKRCGMRWALFGVGAITFVASQAVHIPLNHGLTLLFAKKILPLPPLAWQLPFNAVLLGLTAGLCEEIARYVAYRRFLKDARSWREALMFGAGHGGVEAMILGALAGLGLLNMVLLRNEGLLPLSLPAETREAVRETVAGYWSAPWHASLLGAFERVWAMCLHLSLAVMVLQALTRGRLVWLGAAIGWHAAVNAIAIFGVGTWGPYWTEAALGACGLVSVAIVYALRPGDAERPEQGTTD